MPTPVLGALLLVAGNTGGASPAGADGGGLRLRCAPSGEREFACEFRLTDPADIRSVQAGVDGSPSAPARWEPYPTARSVTTMLVLLDTSALSGGRQAEDIGTLLDLAPAHVRVGLATFDSDLRLVTPIGEPRAALREALRAVKPTDRPTELYRSVLEAIRTVAAVPADRRSLVLFSDGVAEDRAYDHQDVANAASRAGVVVSGFGYPAAGPQRVALQTLRRLGEETGGSFAASDGTAPIPPEILRRSVVALDSGGTLWGDLGPGYPVAGVHQARVSVTVETSRGILREPATLELAARSPAVPGAGETPPVPSATRAPPPLNPRAPEGGNGRADTPARPTPSLYAPLLALAGAASLGWVVWKRRGRRSLPRVTPHGGDTQAYLTFRDDPQREHYALSGSTIRIGRQRDNDLVLEDTSVSRHHAEVHVARDGSLSILDLDSLNGVFVNERQVKSARLNDGDSVEIGDVRLTFSLAAVAGPQRRQAPSALERTVIARTDDFFGGAQKP